MLDPRPVMLLQVDATSKADVVAQQSEALLAGLLFALHPVHTESVAGIVGQAELLCAALSVLALLAYMAAADGRYRVAPVTFMAGWEGIATSCRLLCQVRPCSMLAPFNWKPISSKAFHGRAQKPST